MLSMMFSYFPFDIYRICRNAASLSFDIAHGSFFTDKLARGY
jgi:hypothetical protein